MRFFALCVQHQAETNRDVASSDLPVVVVVDGSDSYITTLSYLDERRRRHYNTRGATN